jgi:hypothetical protein
VGAADACPCRCGRAHPSRTMQSGFYCEVFDFGKGKSKRGRLRPIRREVAKSTTIFTLWTRWFREIFPPHSARVRRDTARTRRRHRPARGSTR